MTEITKDLLEDGSLDDLLAVAGERHAVDFEPVTVDGQALDMLQITNMGEYVDKLAENTAPEDKLELPFWAAIWPAAIMAAYYLRRLPCEGRNLLELGAGVGMTGLFAAAHGFDVTMTDSEPEALLFARINILKNGLADTARVARLDIDSGRLETRFDLIVGSEILYRPDVYRQLVKCLLRHLAPHAEAEAVLVRDFSRKSHPFFKLADREFLRKEMTLGFKENTGRDGEKHLCTIHRLRPRKQA